MLVMRIVVKVILGELRVVKLNVLVERFIFIVKKLDVMNGEVEGVIGGKFILKFSIFNVN